MPDPPKCPIFTQFNQQLQQLIDTSKDDQIKLTIAHLNRQETLNYAAAARLFRIEPTTLRRRHKGLTVSRVEAIQPSANA
jgi:hypothetical protein